MLMLHRTLGLCFVMLCVSRWVEAQQFNVGYARQDITPAKPMPMWGYGARHAALSEGVRESQGVADKMYAKAVVIDVGRTKLAIVGLDLGRSPTDAMMGRIRQAVRQNSAVDLLLISGSHTHHGPVIELLDEPGKGRGKFDDAIAYSKELESKIVQAIDQAAAMAQPARIGWDAKSVDLNRNRHSKREIKPVDSELGVIRFDDLTGKPIALLVNYAAHATMLPAELLKFSGDWPAHMTLQVETLMNTNCLFMQGAAGDLSPKADGEARSIELFGRKMAEQVVDVANTITTTVPKRPRIEGRDEEFEFKTRLPLGNPITALMFSNAFFPELASASLTEDLKHELIHPHLTTVLINRQLALVGGSGEFFCSHSLRLKERLPDIRCFFFGYCNGHNMYLPTIEGAAEGGYGADPMVSWVAIGAGEQMMDRALMTLYEMLGKYDWKLP